MQDTYFNEWLGPVDEFAENIRLRRTPKINLGGPRIQTKHKSQTEIRKNFQIASALLYKKAFRWL